MKLKIARACRRFFLTLIAVLFGFYILSGMQISFHPEKAEKARKGFWTKTLKVAGYVGQLKRALF